MAHLHQMEIWPLENSFIETWPPGSATLLVSHRGATYIVLLALSVGIELVSSATVSQSVSQLSFKKVSVSSLSEFQTPVLIDRTPCTHGSDKKDDEEKVKRGSSFTIFEAS